MVISLGAAVFNMCSLREHLQSSVFHLCSILALVSRLPIVQQSCSDSHTSSIDVSNLTSVRRLPRRTPCTQRSLPCVGVVILLLNIDNSAVALRRSLCTTQPPCVVTRVVIHRVVFHYVILNVTVILQFELRTSIVNSFIILFVLLINSFRIWWVFQCIINSAFDHSRSTMIRDYH